MLRCETFGALGTCQFRARIVFAGFSGLALPESFSGSIRDRKSHAHAPILRNSLMIPLCDGLNGGEDRIRTSGNVCLTPLDG
jgi:hypothetical protein